MENLHKSTFYLNLAHIKLKYFVQNDDACFERNPQDFPTGVENSVEMAGFRQKCIKIHTNRPENPLKYKDFCG